MATRIHEMSPRAKRHALTTTRVSGRCPATTDKSQGVRRTDESSSKELLRRTKERVLSVIHRPHVIQCEHFGGFRPVLERRIQRFTRYERTSAHFLPLA